MKIYIGKGFSCGLNYEYQMLVNSLSSKFYITENPEEADIIIFAGTCSCTKYYIINTIKYMMEILEKKQQHTKVFMTGCMTRDFINDPFLDSVKNWVEQNIDTTIPHGKVNEILQLISNEEYGKLNKNDFGYAYLRNKDSVNAHISEGCLNHCSFCKTTFQKCSLKSVDFDEVTKLIDTINQLKIRELALIGTNICQFGLDKYGKYRLPELLEYIETKENIKVVDLIGFTFKDAIQNGLEEVLSSSKKEIMLSGSLESGSDRLLELIRKGFRSQEIIDFIDHIRKTNDIRLILNIISGFPTETLEDVKMTLEVLKRLKPETVAISRYTNSSFVDSSQYEQLSPEKIQNHTRIYDNVLKRRRVNTIISGKGYFEN